MIVSKDDFDAQSYPEFIIADAPDNLPWHLIYSRSDSYAPISRFELTEERPCSLSSYYQVSSNPGLENISGRTKDPYSLECPFQPLDGAIERSYRAVSPTVTVNEADLMANLGIFSSIDSLDKTDSKSYRKRKEKNNLHLWQRSVGAWESEGCRAYFAQSLNGLSAAKIEIDKEAK